MKTTEDYTDETMHMSNPTHHWGFFPSQIDTTVPNSTPASFFSLRDGGWAKVVTNKIPQQRLRSTLSDALHTKRMGVDVTVRGP
jgi:hypothetical protein